MGQYASALGVCGQFAYATITDHFFLPKSKFGEKDVPDLAGKVIIVTGGNAGIGKATVQGTRLTLDSDSSWTDRFITFIRCFWRRTRRCTLLQEAKHAPRPLSQSCWPRPGRRLSGSSWIFPLSKASKERPLSSTGTLSMPLYYGLTTNPIV